MLSIGLLLSLICFILLFGPIFDNAALNRIWFVLLWRLVEIIGEFTAKKNHNGSKARKYMEKSF